MLPARERLTRADFCRFFASGARAHSPALTLVYATHTHFHASVVVSKKVAPRAVDRNKLRRRIYDILKRYRSARGVTGVYIVLTKPGARTLTYRALKDELTTRLNAITT
jgi:ribonuclease P protein component